MNLWSKVPFSLISCYWCHELPDSALLLTRMACVGVCSEIPDVIIEFLGVIGG